VNLKEPVILAMFLPKPVVVAVSFKKLWLSRCFKRKSLAGAVDSENLWLSWCFQKKFAAGAVNFRKNYHRHGEF
jgi:hypothetical protein